MVEGIHRDVILLFQTLFELVEISNARIIKEHDIIKAQSKSEEFFGQFSRMFFVNNITINTHLVLHVHEIIIAWGPLSNFHVFSYERLNLTIKKIPTSNRSTSESEMLKSQTEKFYMNTNLEGNQSISASRNEVLTSLAITRKLPTSRDAERLLELQLSSFGNEDLPEGSKFEGPFREHKFDKLETFAIKKLLQKMVASNGNAQSNFEIEIPKKCKKYKDFKYGDAKLFADAGNTPINSRPGCLVGLLFTERNSNVPTEYLAQISAFYEFDFNDMTFYFMRVRFWKFRSRRGPLANNKRVIFFDKRRMFPLSADNIVPINRIHARYALLAPDLAVQINLKLRL